MIAAERRTPKQKKELPPLQNGDHLDQKTFHERYEAMPEARVELIGGIVYLSSPQKLRHGRHHLKLTGWLDVYEEATPGIEGYLTTTHILGRRPEQRPVHNGSTERLHGNCAPRLRQAKQGESIDGRT